MKQGTTGVVGRRVHLNGTPPRIERMSFHTLQPPVPPQSSRTVPGRGTGTGSASDGAGNVPASPPPEVLDAIGTAADAYDRLKDAGRRLHFETDPVTGRLSIQVLDDDGNVTATLPPSKVLDLAAGDGLE